MTAALSARTRGPGELDGVITPKPPSLGAGRTSLTLHRRANGVVHGLKSFVNVLRRRRDQPSARGAVVTRGRTPTDAQETIRQT